MKYYTLQLFNKMNKPFQLVPKWNILLLSLLCLSCEVKEAPKPINVAKVTQVYSINHQPHTGVFNPQYLPNLKYNGK